MEFNKKYAEELFKNLTSELNLAAECGLTQSDELEACFSICAKYIERLWQLADETGFQTDHSTIDFFKRILPEFLAEADFFKKKYHALLFKPEGYSQSILFFENELSKLDHFFVENMEFIHYYRNGSTNMDCQFFCSHIRGQRENEISQLIAKFIASERYREYLNKRLHEMRDETKF